MKAVPLAIRNLTAPLIRSATTRIRSGPNAGDRWSLASAGRGYRKGTFESDKVNTLLGLIRPGNRVWDVGAHKGYMTLAAAHRVGPSGHVVAYEPATVNLWFLCRHLEWNGLNHVEVMPIALGDRDKTEAFGGFSSSLALRLGKGDQRVQVRSIRSLIDEGHPAPDVLKIDVEHSEARLLRGALDTLAPHTAMLISIHDYKLYDTCRSLLERHCYRVIDSGPMQRQLADRGQPWGDDHDIIALGPGCKTTDDTLAQLPLVA